MLFKFLVWGKGFILPISIPLMESFPVRLSRSDLEKAFQEIKLKQESCKHSNVQRWGPSYTMRADGSFRKFDSYNCRDCGLSSADPIGGYL